MSRIEYKNSKKFKAKENKPRGTSRGKFTDSSGKKVRFINDDNSKKLYFEMES